MELAKGMLLAFLRWSGWLMTASYAQYIRYFWQTGQKKEFFSSLAYAVGGLFISGFLLSLFCQMGQIDSLILDLVLVFWAGNIFWLFGVITCMCFVDKAVDFVDFYHDWREQLRGPSDTN